MDATIMNDVKHLLAGKKVSNVKYSDDVVAGVDEIGYHIECVNDLISMNGGQLKEFSVKLATEIEYLSSFEQAVKYIMNSLYGGSSHVAFFWFHMNLANCITSEARNIIHLMESHIPGWFQDNWRSAVELHNKLGIKLKNQN